MSEEKIDQKIAENGDREDEAANGLVSDGEIFDDDEPEEPKAASISFLPKKAPKNFRSRQENDSDDELEGKFATFSDFLLLVLTNSIHFRTADDKKNDISGKDFKKILNGGQKLDKCALEGFRKKIMDELDEKKNSKDNNNSRFDRGMKSRNNFNNRNYDNRRNNNNRSFQERSRFVNRNREQ